MDVSSQWISITSGGDRSHGDTLNVQNKSASNHPPPPLQIYFCSAFCLVINRYGRQSCSWSAEQRNLNSPYPRSRLRIWSSETRSTPRSFVTPRLNLVLTHGFFSFPHSETAPFYNDNRHQVSPELIRSRNCVAMVFTAESPPSHFQ